jgi:hypothetical protein
LNFGQILKKNENGKKRITLEASQTSFLKITFTFYFFFLIANTIFFSFNKNVFHCFLKKLWIFSYKFLSNHHFEFLEIDCSIEVRLEPHKIINNIRQPATATRKTQRCQSCFGLVLSSPSSSAA